MSRSQVPLRVLAVVVLGLAVAGCGNSSSSMFPSGTSGAAAAICDQIGGPSGLGGGPSTSDAACAAGYTAAKAGRALDDTCYRLGTGAVTTFENETDCLYGYATAGAAGATKPATPSAAAVGACNHIGGLAGLGGGASTTDAACAQGYDDAKAGRSLQDSCDSLDTGAVASFENIADCEAGFDEAGVEGSGTVPAFTRAAVAACNHIGGPSGLGGGTSTTDGACAQGYVYARAGRSEQSSCESVGYGDVTTFENVADCRRGWSVG